MNLRRLPNSESASALGNRNNCHTKSLISSPAQTIEFKIMSHTSHSIVHDIQFIIFIQMCTTSWFSPLTCDIIAIAPPHHCFGPQATTLAKLAIGSLNQIQACPFAYKSVQFHLGVKTQEYCGLPGQRFWNISIPFSSKPRFLTTG